MCYGSKPVHRDDGRVDWVPNEEFNRLMNEGAIVTRIDGYHYAKDVIGVVVWREKKIETLTMRWDLVPRDFMDKEDVSLAEALKRKNSRAKDPKTGKTVGFSSYNARVETVTKLKSFREPWYEGLRMATPVVAFKERPNMEGAPPEFQGKEYEVLLDGGYYLGGLYDTWENRRGEKMHSCTIITMDSMGNPKVRGIWHERTPFVLRADQLEEWLDPLTTPMRALEMIRQISADHMEIREAPKIESPKPKPEKLQQDLWS